MWMMFDTMTSDASNSLPTAIRHTLCTTHSFPQQAKNFYLKNKRTSPYSRYECHAIACNWCQKASLFLRFSSYFNVYALMVMVIYSGKVTLVGKRSRPVIEIASDDSLKVTWNLSKQSDPPTFLARILSVWTHHTKYCSFSSPVCFSHWWKKTLLRRHKTQLLTT